MVWHPQVLEGFGRICGYPVTHRYTVKSASIFYLLSIPPQFNMNFTLQCEVLGLRAEYQLLIIGLHVNQALCRQKRPTLSQCPDTNTLDS